MTDKLDLSAPHLAGRYFETDDAATEFKFPPTQEKVSETEEVETDLSKNRCDAKGCDGLVKVTEEGNREYAWYYLTNNGDVYAGVTIERRWLYNGRWRRDTVRHRLYPGQHKEVFSFPRRQKPQCCITKCRFE